MLKINLKILWFALTHPGTVWMAFTLMYLGSRLDVPAEDIEVCSTCGHESLKK